MRAECVVAGGFCTFSSSMGAGKGAFMPWDMLVPPWPSVMQVLIG